MQIGEALITPGALMKWKTDHNLSVILCHVMEEHFGENRPANFHILLELCGASLLHVIIYCLLEYISVEF